MRVAVINQYSSAGGGSRFARALVTGLAQADPRSQFDFFADGAAIDRDGLADLFGEYANVRVVPLHSGNVVSADEATRIAAFERLRDRARNVGWVVQLYRWLRRVSGTSPGSQSLTLPPATLKALEAYDVVYLAWPYYIRPLELDVPVVATFHDFNFKHGFGNFTSQQFATVDRDWRDWLISPVQPVCSTNFIAGELDAYYPDHRNEPAVVYLSTFAVHDPAPADVADVAAKFGLPNDYVVCPTNTSPHKNLATLLRAMGRLKRAGSALPLVLTGFGTDDLNRLAQSEKGVRSTYQATLDLHEVRIAEGLELQRDVFALGFVSDREMDALIRGARALVAPSLYEAGSGPALDAWKLGTLVLSSDIPPVLEQMEFLGTRAYLFDANDSEAIADQVLAALGDSETAEIMVEQSRAAMEAYSWKEVGDAYLTVFEQARTSYASSAAAPQSAQNGVIR